MAPMGKFEFTRMPFGLKGAPSTFQRHMDVVLAPCSQYARSYIDDIAMSVACPGRIIFSIFNRLEKAVVTGPT